MVRKLTWLTLGFMGMATGLARADHARDCECIVKLADQMQEHAREMSCEFERSYRWTQQYWDLQSRTQEISSRAGHLKYLAQAGSDFREMKCNLEEISLAHRQLVSMLTDSGATERSVSSWRQQPQACMNNRVRGILECLDKAICQANDDLGGLFSPRSVPTTRRGHDYDRGPTFNGPSTFTYGRPTAGRDYDRSPTFNGSSTFPYGRPTGGHDYNRRSTFNGPSGLTYGRPTGHGNPGISLNNGRLSFYIGR
jgi:hypothetical protein